MRDRRPRPLFKTIARVKRTPPRVTLFAQVMLAVRTTGPSLELPVVVAGLGVLSRRGLGVMVDAANER